MDPRKIIEKAKKRGLNIISITDHNTILGSLETKRVNTDHNFMVIIGVEIKTEYGDLIGLFINKEIHTRKFFEVVREIKSQKGLVILPHPFSKNSNFPEKCIQYVDLIEVMNARCKKIWNKRAQELAEKYKKPVSAGSDAHNYFEIGSCFTKIETSSLAGLKEKLLTNKTYFGKENIYYLSHFMSLVIEKTDLLKNKI